MKKKNAGKLLNDMRNKKLSPERRSEIARNAANVRHGKIDKNKELLHK